MTYLSKVTRMLSHQDVARREALLETLRHADAQVGFVENSQLHSAFFSLDETSRYSITNSMASMKNDLALRLLLAILDRDDSPLVRHEAAFALGCVGDETCRTALRRTLVEDDSFLVRHEAAMALGELGTVDDLPTLEHGLRDTSREVVISCEVALNRILERVSIINPNKPTIY
jgi:hypothetical protein